MFNSTHHSPHIISFISSTHIQIHRNFQLWKSCMDFKILVSESYLLDFFFMNFLKYQATSFICSKMGERWLKVMTMARLYHAVCVLCICKVGWARELKNASGFHIQNGLRRGKSEHRRPVSWPEIEQVKDGNDLELSCWASWKALENTMMLATGCKMQTLPVTSHILTTF